MTKKAKTTFIAKTAGGGKRQEGPTHVQRMSWVTGSRGGIGARLRMVKL